MQNAFHYRELLSRAKAEMDHGRLFAATHAQTAAGVETFEELAELARNEERQHSPKGISDLESQANKARDEWGAAQSRAEQINQQIADKKIRYQTALRNLAEAEGALEALEGELSGIEGAIQENIARLVDPIEVRIQATDPQAVARAMLREDWIMRLRLRKELAPTRISKMKEAVAKLKAELKAI